METTGREPPARAHSAHIGIFFFDGNGNVSGSQSISRNGVFYGLMRPISGILLVAADCTAKFLTDTGDEVARVHHRRRGKWSFTSSGIRRVMRFLGFRKKNPQLRRRSLKTISNPRCRAGAFLSGSVLRLAPLTYRSSRRPSNPYLTNRPCRRLPDVRIGSLYRHDRYQCADSPHSLSNYRCEGRGERQPGFPSSHQEADPIVLRWR